MPKRKSSARDTRQTLVLRKVLNDLVRDLSLIDGQKSRQMETLLKKISNEEILVALADQNSSLCRCIPTGLLLQDEAGQRYMKILGTFQPKYDEMLSAHLAISKEANNKTV